MSSAPSLSREQCITLACLLEATAPKVGNVHRGADFEDCTYTDFAVSGILAAPSLANAHEGVGKAVMGAVNATRSRVTTNTNLGIALLLAPLAAIPTTMSWDQGIAQVLASLTSEDAAAIYEAINLATPGGLGDVAEMDVRDTPPNDLMAAMNAAAERDLVARQYRDRFEIVLDEAAPWIEQAAEQFSTSQAIVIAHLKLMRSYPDTLIARKLGEEVAAQASDRAAFVLETDPAEHLFWDLTADFDFWLRSDHHRRNPGATADLIAAALYVLLRDNRLPHPWA